MANSVDPDQMPQNVASDLGLHYFLRPIYPIILRVITVCIALDKMLVISVDIFLLFPQKKTTGNSTEYP